MIADRDPISAEPTPTPLITAVPRPRAFDPAGDDDRSPVGRFSEPQLSTAADRSAAFLCLRHADGLKTDKWSMFALKEIRPMADVSPLAPASFPTMAPIAGVRLAAHAAGIRYTGRNDMMVAELAPGTHGRRRLHAIDDAGPAGDLVPPMPAARHGARDCRQFRQRQRLYRPRRVAGGREHRGERRRGCSAANRTKSISRRPASSASRRRPTGSAPRCPKIVAHARRPRPGRRRRARS